MNQYIAALLCLLGGLVFGAILFHPDVVFSKWFWRDLLRFKHRWYETIDYRRCTCCGQTETFQHMHGWTCVKKGDGQC